MAGQHIEREARFEQTGISPAQRETYVWEQHNRGVSYEKIGKRLGMSKSAVKYIFDRLSGHPRQPATASDMCQGCWSDFPKSKLNAAGLCDACAGTAVEKPSPPEKW
jgi:hypothetical protein